MASPSSKALSDGELLDGQTVSVDADVKPRGEFVAGDVVDEASAKTIVEDIPGLASKQMCDQVALFLVEETGQALIEAEVTVPHSSVEWSVIEAIDPRSCRPTSRCRSARSRATPARRRSGWPRGSRLARPSRTSASGPSATASGSNVLRFRLGDRINNIPVVQIIQGLERIDALG